MPRSLVAELHTLVVGSERRPKVATVQHLVDPESLVAAAKSAVGQIDTVDPVAKELVGHLAALVGMVRVARQSGLVGKLAPLAVEVPHRRQRRALAHEHHCQHQLG